MESTTVRELTSGNRDAVTRVLCDAFRDYPVMRHVVGAVRANYDERLERLIGFFVAARVLREEPMIGIGTGDDLAAVAIMTPPGVRESSQALDAERQSMWDVLGSAARARYDALGQVWSGFAIEEPNFHLNMIGVRQTHAGRGLGRRLLDHVHRMSASDPGSTGVTLTTETAVNVPLYEHFGYRIVGHARVTDALETWGFFRPDMGQ